MKIAGIVFLLLVAINVITYRLYAYDKRNAEFNGPSKLLKYPRVAERKLHFFSFLGGWPGALFAQQTLRHKTRKKSFQTMFWRTVLVNIVIVVLLFTSFTAIIISNW